MCKADKTTTDSTPAEESKSNVGMFKAIIAILSAACVALLISTIVLAKDNKPKTKKVVQVPNTQAEGTNPCANKKPDFPNVACIVDEIEMTGEQSGVNVTLGYQGDRDTSASPITEPYWSAGLCPVNVSLQLRNDQILTVHQFP